MTVLFENTRLLLNPSLVDPDTHPLTTLMNCQTLLVAHHWPSFYCQCFGMLRFRVFGYDDSKILSALNHLLIPIPHGQ